MATYRRKFPTHREHPAIAMRRNRAAMSAFVPDEKRAQFEADFPESRLPPLPKKRGPRVEHEDLEGPVNRAISQLLAVHPAVLWVCRQNSGAAMTERGGRHVPMPFYRILREPDEDTTIVDFWGFLTNGRPLALEGKKLSWTKPSTPREFKQQRFLAMIQSIGGLAAFVRSADEVGALLA
jgi:hypothetical protein